MVRKTKNTGNNIPEIILIPPVEEQEQIYGKSSSQQQSKNNKLHKKRKNREQEQQTKKYNLPKIVITDLSDEVQDKGLTNSYLNSNKKIPKNIINIEDNEIISTNHDFVDFDYTSNETINIKKEGPITNKNSLNNPSIKNIKTKQLWKFLKKKFLIKGYDLQTIN